MNPANMIQSNQDGPLTTAERKAYLVSNLLQIGLKAILLMFPFAVAWSTWVTVEVFGSKATSSTFREVKAKQESLISDVAHIKVVDERLRFITEQLSEIKSDVRDLKPRP